MTKRIVWALVILACVIAGLPYLPASLFQPAIARALERSLGRKVEVGEVHLSLFGMPGFSIDDVTIYEDPHAGIEPFAYVGSLGADVNLFALLRRKLEFSTIRLGDASINLVKPDAGPWNFQYLLNSPAAAAGAIPSIKMRKGRVNFKFGDTKSVFYFDDADLQVTPNSDGSVELRFGGAPSRTDRSAQNFGHFYVRGNWVPSAQKLDLNVELERSSLDEVLKLSDSNSFGVHGVVSMEAQVSGFTSNLNIDGSVQLDDLHRWDLLPQKGGGWKQRYHGTLDLRGEKLELKTIADGPHPPLALEFQAESYLSAPKWEAVGNLDSLPIATLVEIARHMGAPLPDKLAADGSISGTLSYSRVAGLEGNIEVGEASLALPDSPPLKAPAVHVTVKDGGAKIEPVTVQIGETNKAVIEASYLGATQAFDLKLSTPALSVADTRSFGLKAIPLLEHTPQGTWRGWARYHAGDWTGEYELLNAKVAVDGLAEPLLIQSAAVSLTGDRASANKLRAKIGAIAFSGDYRWEPAATRPHKFHLRIAEADLAEMNRLLQPTLVRQGSFLETLRLGSTALPDWLKGRRAEGTIAIGDLTADDRTIHIEKAQVEWDEAKVRFKDLDALIDDSSLQGELEILLDSRQPRFHFQGKIEGVPYKGGTLDFDGTADSEGSGAQLLAAARAQGAIRGQSVAFAPDADFRTIAGKFELKNLVWKLSNVEVTQGADSLTGAGASQSDGKLVLELTGRNRQYRYSGPLLAGAQ
jgi:hypothetical protein